MSSDVEKEVNDLVEKSNNSQVAVDKILKDKHDAESLLNEYSDAELSITKILLEIDEFKKKHKDVFDELAKLEAKITDINVIQTERKNKILECIRKTNAVLPLENGSHKVTYVESTIKRNFDTTRFYNTYKPDSSMYKTYVKESNVSDYIKIAKKK